MQASPAEYLAAGLVTHLLQRSNASRLVATAAFGCAGDLKRSTDAIEAVLLFEHRVRYMRLSGLPSKRRGATALCLECFFSKCDAKIIWRCRAMAIE